MANILIAEDEAAMVEIIADYMRRGGHACFAARDGAEALAILSAGPMDLMILDVMMPHLDGFSVCKMAREMSNMPIIMLTAKSNEDDKLKGYDLGADDYMTKPFRPLELVARVKAQLRRYKRYNHPRAQAAAGSSLIIHGGLVMNVKTHECLLDEKPLPLTPTEFSILKILCERKGEAVSSEDLFHSVWKDEYYSKSNNTITVHIRHLREKMNDSVEHPKYIKTIWGVGYKIENG